MIRLWVRPDGTFAETVYADERPEMVARANATLAAHFPGATPEDYSNDAYEALKPKDGSAPSRWRKQGARIVVVPAVPDARATARQALTAATTVAELKAALEKLL